MVRTGYLWGMHWLGWIFWILLIALVVVVVVRLVWPRSSPSLSPVEELKRSYANGEISPSEFKKRKAGLKS